MSEKLRQVLRAGCDRSEVLQLFRTDVKALAYQFELSDAERERLEQSHILMVLVGKSPAGTTTTSPITITDC